jgi:hypothetical protein
LAWIAPGPCSAPNQLPCRSPNRVHSSWRHLNSFIQVRAATCFSKTGLGLPQPITKEWVSVPRSVSHDVASMRLMRPAPSIEGRRGCQATFLSCRPCQGSLPASAVCEPSYPNEPRSSLSTDFFRPTDGVCIADQRSSNHSQRRGFGWLVSQRRHPRRVTGSVGSPTKRSASMDPPVGCQACDRGGVRN